jgi:hypothetical protein
MGWKDDLDRKFLDTIRQLKLRSSELESQLKQTQAVLAKCTEINESLARRVTQQTLLITELRESHPQVVEIDEIFDATLENQRMRRSQILRLKIELEQSRKSLEYRESGSNISLVARTPDVSGRDSLQHIEVQ